MSIYYIKSQRTWVKHGFVYVYTVGDCSGKKTHTIISNINWNKEGMKKANKIVEFSIAYVVCAITRRASPFMLWCYTVANIQRG